MRVVCRPLLLCNAARESNSSSPTSLLRQSDWVAIFPYYTIRMEKKSRLIKKKKQKTKQWRLNGNGRHHKWPNSFQLPADDALRSHFFLILDIDAHPVCLHDAVISLSQSATSIDSHLGGGWKNKNKKMKRNWNDIISWPSSFLSYGGCC